MPGHVYLVALLANCKLSNAAETMDEPARRSHAGRSGSRSMIAGVDVKYQSAKRRGAAAVICQTLALRLGA